MTDRKSLKILVIDDEGTQRLLAKEYLESAGHVVRQSEDGKHGLKMAVKVRPDVILLDLCLPSMDGYSLCRTLRQTPETADTPIILITAERSSDAIEKGLEAGADDFVTKPVDWEFLADRVVNVWRKSRARTAVPDSVRSETEERSEQTLDSAVEDMILSADVLSADSESVLAAEMERMAAEHRAELEQAMEGARAESEARFAELEEKLAAEKEAAVLATERRYVSEREKAVAEAVVAREAELKKQLADQNRLHAEEIANLRHERETAVAEASAAQAREIELRETLSSMEKIWDEEIAAAQDGAITDAWKEFQATWALAYRWITAHTKHSAAQLARIRTASGSGLPADGLREVEQHMRALHNSLGQFKVYAGIVLAAEESAKHPVAINELIKEIVAHCRAAAKGRRIDLSCKVPAAPLTVDAEVAKLRYALLSLLINAIRFTPAGGGIAVEANVDAAGNIVIGVHDNGVGIAPAKLAEIRDCLKNPLAATTENAEETGGLGLPIVMGLVDQLNGRFSIESHLGRGTSVTLNIPKASGEAVETYPQTSPMQKRAG